MTVGTKSILFGAHQFMIHPWFVAWAWWKLFGFPWDPRLWIAFFIHDLGYWGKPNMDGPDGEKHVQWAARVMSRWFDDLNPKDSLFRPYVNPYVIPSAQLWVMLNLEESTTGRLEYFGKWGQLCLLHSRFYAKKLDVNFSKLCVADKLALCLEPWWLYLPRVNLSSEVHEYMKLASKREIAGESKYQSMKMSTNTQRAWFTSMTDYLRRWVQEHKDMKQDLWTPVVKHARDEHGVLQ